MKQEKDKTKIMSELRILNVVELRGDYDISISSFHIDETSETPHPEIENVENDFVTKAKENGFKGDEEELKDEGMWQTHDYKIYLIWSN